MFYEIFSEFEEEDFAASATFTHWPTAGRVYRGGPTASATAATTG